MVVIITTVFGGTYSIDISCFSALEIKEIDKVVDKLSTIYY